jgi:hypothetical protein
MSCKRPIIIEQRYSCLLLLVILAQVLPCLHPGTLAYLLALAGFKKFVCRLPLERVYSGRRIESDASHVRHCIRLGIGRRHQVVRGCTLVHVCVGVLKSWATQHVTILLKDLPRDMLHYTRGRPRAQRQSMADMTRLWYLYTIGGGLLSLPVRSVASGLSRVLAMALRSLGEYDRLLQPLREKASSWSSYVLSDDLR